MGSSTSAVVPDLGDGTICNTKADGFGCSALIDPGVPGCPTDAHVTVTEQPGSTTTDNGKCTCNLESDCVVDQNDCHAATTFVISWTRYPSGQNYEYKLYIENSGGGWGAYGLSPWTGDFDVQNCNPAIGDTKNCVHFRISKVNPDGSEVVRCEWYSCVKCLECQPFDDC